MTLRKTLNAALPLVGSLDADRVIDVELDYSVEGWLSVVCEGGEGGEDSVELADSHGRPEQVWSEALCVCC